jgi:hypothetical protein
MRLRYTSATLLPYFSCAALPPARTGEHPEYPEVLDQLRAGAPRNSTRRARLRRAATPLRT